LKIIKTWETAQLYQEDKGDEPKYWSWTLWKYEANNLPSPCEIVCRACNFFFFSFFLKK